MAGVGNKPNEVFEVMTKSSYRGWTIRVWSECTSFSLGPDNRVAHLLDRLAMDPYEFSVLDVVTKLKKLGRIAAIEVVDNLGNGGLCYPDWS